MQNLWKNSSKHNVLIIWLTKTDEKLVKSQRLNLDLQKIAKTLLMVRNLWLPIKKNNDGKDISNFLLGN